MFCNILIDFLKNFVGIRNFPKVLKKYFSGFFYIILKKMQKSKKMENSEKNAICGLFRKFLKKTRSTIISYFFHYFPKIRDLGNFWKKMLQVTIFEISDPRRNFKNIVISVNFRDFWQKLAESPFFFVQKTKNSRTQKKKKKCS